MELNNKFKALTKYNKEWVYGLPMYDYRCVAGKSESVLCIQESSDTAIKLKYEIIPETLCEYTGLKDKNGKEIYSGDIVDKSYISPLNNEKIIQHYVIEWEKGMYKSTFIKDKPYYDRYLWMEGEPLEVIGNIYDNPELLQETSNE